jgi:hypothetical protein
MPPATFSFSGADSHRGSGQSIVDDSDFEDLGANHESNNSPSRHYWLGKLVFAHLLAEAVFRDTPVLNSGDSLDVRHLVRIQKVCMLTLIPGSSYEQNDELSVLVSNHAPCSYRYESVTKP